MNIDELKIVRAVFNGRNTARTNAVFQYDKGRWLVIEGLDLPASYQVHFSNSPDKPAKPIVGNSSGVLVPDDLLESGEPVYAWLYITDNIAGLTVKVIIIPVTARASTEDYTPTPSEQTAFDLAVNAINAAAASVETAVGTVNEKVQTALAEAKASGEFDGPKGDKGDPGTPGAPGATPVRGTDYWTAADKEEIVTQAVEQTETDVAELKSAFEELEAHTDTAEYKQSIADRVAGDFVQDVQVNGQSVVNNGVANVPKATANVLGAVKVPLAGGLFAEDGSVYVNSATVAHVKAGTQSFWPLTPARQHEAAFYGLAKAAGDTTQSASGNAVGSYTEQAKTAIKAMLGITDASGETWHTIELGMADYDSDKHMFLLDVGNGNSIKCATIFGQIINDGSHSVSSNLEIGFGDNATAQFYSVPAFLNGMDSASRRVSFAAKIEMIDPIALADYTTIRCAVAHYFRAGTSTNALHQINVDTAMTRGETRATNFYWNYNSPRYLKIAVPQWVAEWATIRINYTLA